MILNPTPRVSHWAVAVALALMSSSPLLAQTAQQAQPADTGARGGPPQDEDPDIIVTAGQRQRGAVVGDIKPEVQISPAEIRSYGVSSITELLAAIAPQTSSGRGGSPVVLLNGKRISGFGEIRDIPPEAIARVDILPEEVALKYGYTSDQKVVNIVLRQRFRAYTAEMNYGQATSGGAQLYQPEVSFLRLRRDTRLNIDLQYPIQDGLHENQRGIIEATPSRPFAVGGNVVDASGAVFGVLPSAAQHSPTATDFTTTPNTSDITAARSLTPTTKNFSGNLVYSQPILGTVSATVNFTETLNDSQSDNGLPSIALPIAPGSVYAPFANQPVTLYRYISTDGALTQHTKSSAEHFGLTLNADINRHWRWSFTGTYDVSDSRTATETGFATSTVTNLLTTNPSLNPYGPIPAALLPLSAANQTRSLSNSGAIDLLVNGDLIKLPAGELSTSVKLADQNALADSSATRFGTALTTHVRQGVTTGQINVDVPLTSRKKNVLRALGDISLNGNASYKYLTDFGSLTSNGFGFNWSPRDPLTVIVAFTNDHAAPSVGQLNNPQVSTPNALVFDPLTGQTETVTQISGGNPNLQSSDRHVMKLEANWKPLSNPDLTLNATYTRINTNNLIGAPTLAQAFATKTIDPVTGGVSINTSPINFARAETEQLRWGVDFSKALKSSRQPPAGAFRRPGGEGAAPSGAPRGGAPGGQGGGGRGGPPGGGGFGGGRMQIGVYHTLFLHDTLLIKPGTTPLNLLNGDESGSSGGQPRHKVDLQGGYFKDGIGARLSGTWQSATTVNGLTPTGTLHFGDQFTTSARLFINLGQMPKLVAKNRWLRGSRLLLVVNNLFNVHQTVTDGTGAVPFSYQPGYQDPTGRTVRIAFRKIFF